MPNQPEAKNSRSWERGDSLRTRAERSKARQPDERARMPALPVPPPPPPPPEDSHLPGCRWTEIAAGDDPYGDKELHRAFHTWIQDTRG